MSFIFRGQPVRRSLALLLVLFAGAGGERLSSQADSTLRRLEISRITAEVRKIDAERERLEAERGNYAFAWGLGVAGLTAILSAITALIAVASLGGAGFKYVRDRRAEREQRAHDRFSVAVAALGSQELAARAAAAVTLETFADYTVSPFLRERAVRVLMAHLRLPLGDELQPTLVNALSVLARGRALNALDARRANLTGIMLENAILDQADFRESTLDHGSFRGGSLNGARFDGATGNTVKFSTGAELRKAHFTNAELSGWDFGGADLREAVFVDCRLSKVNFDGARLDGAKFANVLHDPVTLVSLSRAGIRSAKIDARLTGELKQLAVAAPSG